MNDDDFLTVREVAEQFRVTEQTVRKWVRDGRLAATKLPGGKNLLIRRGDARALVRGGDEVVPPSAPVSTQVGVPFKATDSRVVRPAQVTPNR
jgi:excisionase family DNA binding protein